MLGRYTSDKAERACARLLLGKGNCRGRDVPLEVFKLKTLQFFGEVVIPSAYFPRLGQILQDLQDDGIALSGKSVIDTMSPLNVEANFNHYQDLGHIECISITEKLLGALPKAIIVKAVNLVPSTLQNMQRWTPGRVLPIILIGGNSSSINTVRQLIGDAGSRPQFSGYSLHHSGLLERLGVLLHLLMENEYVKCDVMEKD